MNYSAIEIALCVIIVIVLLAVTQTRDLAVKDEIREHVAGKYSVVKARALAAKF